MAGPTGRRKRDTLTFTDGRKDLSLEKDMSSETWALVKSKLFDHTDTIELGGLGEPTLGKIFVEAAADVIAAGKQLFFFTNGHFLNLPRVLDVVGDTPHISISIDAGTPETYKSFRKGELEDLKKSVKAFRAAKPNAKLDSQFTATTDNIDDLPAFVELCAELGIGRYHHGEQILVVGADHHATSRVDKSIRFAKERTLAAVDKARSIAEGHELYLLANLPAFSDLNPNAAVDGSDPRKLRRWADLMFFGANPCGATDVTDIGSTGLVTATDVSVGGGPGEEVPLGGPAFMAPAPADEEIERIPTAKEMYVDYDGKVWSCLARHEIGDLRTGDWISIVEQNPEYQTFLANWFFGVSNQNPECKSCPRRK